MPTAPPPPKPRKRPAPASNLSAFGSPAKAIQWDPVVSEEEQLRRQFRSLMALAFVKPPHRPDVVEEKTEKVIRAIFDWCQQNKAGVFGCQIVLRGRHLDVLLFEPLREYDERVAAELSELGIILGESGVYARVLPVGLAEGEKPDDGDYGNGDPVMGLQWQSR